MEILDQASSEESYSGDDLALLCEEGPDGPTYYEFMNGEFRHLHPLLLDECRYYTLRTVNDYELVNGRLVPAAKGG